MAARDIRGVLRPAAPTSSPGLLPVEQPISWPRWDDGELRLSVVDANAVAVNLTGWAFSWTVRGKNDDGSIAAKLSRLGAITSAAAGKVSFGVASVDWSAFVEHEVYRHDVVGIDPDGARHQVVPQSTLTVLPAVTQPLDLPTLPASPSPLPYPVASVTGIGDIVVDNTDPMNPIVSSTTTGVVAGLGAGAGMAVDSTDPINPIVALGWAGLVGDNQVLVRNGSALAGSYKTSADWAGTLTRFYAVDPVAGNDARIGFVDAPHGTVFAPSTLDAVALKTYEEAYARFPRTGNRRRLVCLIKGNANAATPISCFKKDGVTLDDITHDGISGYEIFITRVSDFTNSADDKLFMATMPHPLGVGPDVGGSWTVASFSTPVVTIAGATALPSGLQIEGATVAWEGNVTAGARRCGVVKYVRATNQVEMGFASTLNFPVVAGDRFTLRQPSVRFRSWVGDSSNVAYFAGPTSFFGAMVGAFEFSQGSASTTTIWGNANPVMCRWTTSGILRIASAGRQFYIPSLYADETLATVRCGHSFTVFGGSGIFLEGGSSIGGGGAQLANFVFVGNGANGTALILDEMNLLQVGLASAVFARVLLIGCRVVTRPGNVQGIGFGGNDDKRRCVVRCRGVGPALTVEGGVVNFIFTQVADTTNALRIQSLGALVHLQAMTGDGGISGYGLDLDDANCRDASVTVEAANTVTGTAGNILVGGIVKTWAEVIAQGYVNARGNKVSGIATAAIIERLEAGTLDVPALTSDPVTNPAAGKVRLWFNTTTKQLKIRESDGTTKVI